MNNSYINLKKEQGERIIVLMLSFVHLFSDFIQITCKHVQWPCIKMYGTLLKLGHHMVQPQNATFKGQFSQQAKNEKNSIFYSSLLKDIKKNVIHRPY